MSIKILKKKEPKVAKATTTSTALENITFPNCQVEITITDGKITFLKAHNSSPITKQSKQSIINICKSSNGVYGQNAYCEGTEAEVLDFISKLN